MTSLAPRQIAAETAPTNVLYVVYVYVCVCVEWGQSSCRSYLQGVFCCLVVGDREILLYDVVAAMYVANFCKLSW